MNRIKWILIPTAVVLFASCEEKREYTPEKKLEVELSDLEFVSFPRLATKMHKPEGFEDSVNYNGFFDSDSGIQLRVERERNPVYEAKHKYDSKKLFELGFHARSRENFNLSDSDATLLRLAKSIEGSQVNQWVYIRGDETSAVIATATFPDDQEERYSDLLKKIVMAVEFTKLPEDKNEGDESTVDENSADKTGEDKTGTDKTGGQNNGGGEVENAEKDGNAGTQENNSSDKND